LLKCRREGVQPAAAPKTRGAGWSTPVAVLLLVLFTFLPCAIGGDGHTNLPKSRPFVWNQDAFWEDLENTFRSLRKSGCADVKPALQARFSRIRSLVRETERRHLAPDAPELTVMERELFEITPIIGGCRDGFKEFLELSVRLRLALKRQSESWNMDSYAVRATLYRLLYGLRAAAEEIILQMEQGAAPPLTILVQEPSGAPSIRIAGVEVHSGDILISRGGAPTSALIARGNDFPGNFSHAALLYVDAETKEARIVESVIEEGMILTTVEEYLKDKKLRIMILRLRGDLPEVVRDPLLPHRAALYAFTRASGRHVPYDFEMNTRDHSKLFCAEVVSSAYETRGVRLWKGLSHISSPGLKSWLGNLGVRYFETQEPSDLEYDPQVRIVAEWRDPETLRKDHMDNAATDVLLEGAEAGDELACSWYMLPVAQAVKIYSSVFNLAGRAGPIPEGLSAAAALRTDGYRKKHGEIVQRLSQKALTFHKLNGYHAPYWQLLKLARQAKSEAEGK
jgi:hypothetical protein